MVISSGSYEKLTSFDKLGDKKIGLEGKCKLSPGSADQLPEIPEGA